MAAIARMWSRALVAEAVRSQGNVHRVTGDDGTIVDLYHTLPPQRGARLTLELRPECPSKPDTRTLFVGRGTTCRGQPTSVVSCGGLLVQLPALHADIPADPFVVVRTAA